MNSTKAIVTYGEVLWDVFPDGRQLGGAPFNVAAHCRLLGVSSRMISAVGLDEPGAGILSEADRLGVDRELIESLADYPTGTVQVTTDANGQPTYRILSPVAWDYIRISDAAIESVQQAGAFVYGSLACRHAVSRETLFSLLRQAKTRVLDLNIRQEFYTPELIASLLDHSDILKINEDELELLSKLYDLSPETLPHWLLEHKRIRLVVVTRGAEGAEAFTQHEHCQTPGVAVQVVNTVGSGDAFLAAFLVHYLQGESLQNCLEQACERGAFVATQPGAIPR